MDTSVRPTEAGGMHHEEDFARLTDSQLKVRQRITTRRLVRLLIPGGALSHKVSE
jgi:hypothetical protein